MSLNQSLNQIESQALNLSEEDRLALTQKLLISLENTSQFMEAGWLKQACDQIKQSQTDSPVAKPEKVEDIKKRHLHFLDELSNK